MKNHHLPPPCEGTGECSAPRVLVEEFVSDIRRRARAVEYLLSPRRPSWSFDPDALPTDDAERLVAIKQEVDKTFTAAFTTRPRGRRPTPRTAA